ncbi:MAG: hypothetical protein J5601_06445, partial [Elusimicrobiaceae bacterium]|nr:hypothetical protein [Elusimicrobiaceae bacterium]
PVPDQARDDNSYLNYIFRRNNELSGIFFRRCGIPLHIVKGGTAGRGGVEVAHRAVAGGNATTPSRFRFATARPPLLDKKGT